MKKAMTIILTAALASAMLAGCGNTDSSDTNSTTDTTVNTAAEPAVTEPEIKLLDAPALTDAQKTGSEVIPLWQEHEIPFALEGENLPQCTIQAYPVEGSKGCVVIFPGGGYFQLSVDSEGTQIAKAYNDLGITAFVACYRFKPYDGRAILSDAQRAVQFVRYYAEDFGIDADKIALCGFSAGGHLAMLTAQHPCEDNIIGDVIGAVDSRPNACILAYPVVTLGDGTYPTMPEVFLAHTASNPDEIAHYSYLHALDTMPPTFVFTSLKDTLVDYTKNSAAIAADMEKLGLTYEYKEYADGGHGVGLGTQFPEYSAWVADSAAFLNEHVFG